MNKIIIHFLMVKKTFCVLLLWLKMLKIVWIVDELVWVDLIAHVSVESFHPQWMSLCRCHESQANHSRMVRALRCLRKLFQ
jgi:hypothetical protein